MAGVSVSVTVEVGHLSAEIDDDVIADWIESRLNDGRNTFIMHMSDGGHGYAYGDHVASAPGEYPQTWGGALANSPTPEMHGSRSGSLTSDLEYAGYLTTGTTIMEPRQMFAEALREVIDARPETDVLRGAVKIGEPTG